MNNGVSRGETAVKSAKDVFDLTITTDESETYDVPMDVVHVVYEFFQPKMSPFSTHTLI